MQQPFRSHLCHTRLLAYALGLACLALAGCEGSLHDVVARGDAARTQAMLRRDPAAAHSRDRLGKTPLHHAMTFQRLEMMPLLLENGADIAAADITGMTPLHGAALLGLAEAAESLLALGAPAHARDIFGSTPAHTAAVFGRSSVLRVLAAHGADLRARNHADLAPLDLARKYGHEPVARNILRLLAMFPQTAGGTP